MPDTSPPTVTNLENFDFLHLLRMLADGQKTGVLSVVQEQGTFLCSLKQGLVQALQFGKLEGAEALAYLLQHPTGRFQFEEGQRGPEPTMNSTLDLVALGAFDALPDLPLPFDGPARITSPERLAALPWTTEEQQLLRQIERQTPLAEMKADATARRLISRLSRLGLLKPRKSRVARLTVALTHEVRGVAVLDRLIFQRWKEDLLRPPQKLAVRDDAGTTYTFVLREGPNLGTRLLLPPDLLMQTRLRAGDSVLVKPV